MIAAENSKNDLKSDVNSRLKSDPITDIDFDIILQVPHLFAVSTSELSSSDGENPILNGLPRRQFYRSHMLTLRSCSVNVGRLNSEVVRSMWASLSWELLYLTNDDDERYSIQVNVD